MSMFAARGAAMALATGLALLPAVQAGAADVCSAWAEPARVANQVKLRQRNRMRADRAWVLEVARNPQARFGYDTILMTPQERNEFQARFTRSSNDAARREPMISQARAYAEQYPNQFAGSYLRSPSDYFFDPPLAFVLRFTGDIAAHETALKSLPVADIPLEILPARFSMKQLEDLMEILQRRYEALPEDGDIKLRSYGPSVQKNVIEVEAESNASDAAARLEAGYGGKVKAIIYPMQDDTKRMAVTEGKGWRLLGRASHRGASRDSEGTRMAASEAQWRSLQAQSNLPPPLRRVDFRREIVLTFTESLGCGEIQLDDIVIDASLQSIEAKFSRAGSPRSLCALIYIGYEEFAVAIERAVLPQNPITVPSREAAVDFQNLEYCPRGLVIPRQ